MSRAVRTLAVLVTALVLGGCSGADRDAQLASKRATTTTAAPDAESLLADLENATPEQLAEAARKAAEAAGAAGGSDAGGSAGGGGTTPTTAFDPASHPLAPKNPSPMRQGQPRNPNADTVPVALSVEAPRCATIGSTYRVTILSEPDVDVAMIIGFSDGEAHDSQALGTTGPEGRLVLEVAISPKAPPGEADLMVIAAAPDQRHNHHERKINVIKSGAKCA